MTRSLTVCLVVLTLSCFVACDRKSEQEDEPESAQFRPPDVSSTVTRQALRDGDYDTMRYWLATEVVEYIEAHELYRE